MESSPIPGEDKLLLWDQAAFERRKDSDQEKELLKENLVVEMPVFAGKKAVGDPPCDVGFLFGRFFSFSFRLFGLDLFLLEGKVLLREYQSDSGAAQRRSIKS